MSGSLEALYGPIEGVWLQARIDEFWAGTEPYEYECVDSNRVKRVGVTSEEDAYDEAVTCCGRMDMLFGPSPGGFTYGYGFNYGH